MTAVIGIGFEQFATSETPQTLAAPDVKLLAPDAAAEGKSCLFLPMDQCSIGWSAAYYLRFGLRLLVEPVYDTSHRVVGDVKLTATSVGMWETILLLCIPWSTRY